MKLENLKIAIIGLGYVGLPLAVEFGKKVPVIGFDIYQKRIDELKSGQDHTLEVSPEELRHLSQFSCLINLKNYNISMPFLNINQFFEEMSLYNLRYFLNIKSSLLSLQR